jgi:hypothetical protein
MRPIYVLAALLLFEGASFGQNLPKFSGLMFGDYYYVAQNHDQTQKNMQAIDYRRIYLTADYTIADGFWARFRLESDPTGSNLGNGKLSTWVKDAFIDWKNPLGNSDLVIGLQGTWNINMAEGIFGYRPLEKTIQDLHGISASRDLGISLTERFSDQFSAGLLVGNNSGNSGGLYPSNANGLGTNVNLAYRYKTGYLFLQFVPVKGFTILLDGQYSGAPKQQDITTGDVIVNYTNKDFSLGAQGFVNSVKNGEPDGSTLSRNGISFNGWVALAKDIHLVGRYDYYVGATDAALKNTTYPFSTQSFVLGALDFAVRNNVHFMPNVEYTSYGVADSKPDVLYRVTYYFSF